MVNSVLRNRLEVVDFAKLDLDVLVVVVVTVVSLTPLSLEPRELMLA